VARTLTDARIGPALGSAGTYDRGVVPVAAEIRRNATLVGFAGVAFLAMQVAAGGLTRPLGAHELSLLPIDDVPALAVRAGAMLLSTAALISAFRAWVRPAGRVAAAGAFFFATTWLPAVAGAELRVGLYAALAAVAAAGFVTRWLYERDRGALVAAALSVMAVAWWHPAAGAGLVPALIGVLVVWGRLASWPGVLAVVSGGVAGGVLLGAVPLGALGAGLPVAGDARWLGTVITLAAVVVLVTVALIEQRWPHRRNAATVAVAVTVGVLIGIALGDGMTIGALASAHSVLAIGAGSGMLALWHTVRKIPTLVATLGLVVLTALLIVVQVMVAVQADGDLATHAQAGAAPP
jgi:hypothetical protein